MNLILRSAWARSTPSTSAVLRSRISSPLCSAASSMVPPETRVLTPLRHCPHLLEGQTLCLWRQGSTRSTSRWDPSKYTAIFAIQAAWRWLACYELWYETGEWPLPEAK